MDEAGLEGCNKILRKARVNLARKTSQNDNLADILARMWVGSDPKVNKERLHGKPFCKHCNLFGHGTRYCRYHNIVEGALLHDDHLFALLTYY